MAQPAPPPPPIPTRPLVVLAVLEGLAMMVVALRGVVLPGSVDLHRPLHLAWLVGCLMLAAAAVATFVVRSSRLLPRLAQGEDVADARSSIFFTSMAILVVVFLLAAIGPGVFEQLLVEQHPRVG